MTTLDDLRRALRTHAGDDVSVIATTADGAVVFWSRGARRLYGWTEAEALGRNIIDLTPAIQSRRAAGEIMDRLRRGEPWDGEIVLRRKGGGLLRAFVADMRAPLGESEAGVIVGVSGPAERRDAILASAEALRGVLAAG